MKHTAPQARDFDAATRAALLTAGIRIIGVQALPVDGSFLQTETGYCVDDNGTGRVWTREQVLMRAETEAERRRQPDALPEYKLIDGVVGRLAGTAYRFYCYPSSWAISPAARGGYVLEGV